MYNNVSQSGSIGRSLLVFVLGTVTGAFLLGSASFFVVKTYGIQFINSYVLSNNFVTRSQYLDLLKKQQSLSEHNQLIESRLSGIKVEFINSLRQLPLRSPPVPVDKPEISKNAIKLAGDPDSAYVVASDLSPSEIQQHECALLVIKYADHPNDKLLHQIDAKCK